MRFVAAFAGVVIGIFPLIFFWVGAQTFVRPLERALAFAMVVETGALILLSLALFFTPAVQRIQAIILVATIVSTALILITYRMLR
jgi:hypothetical protein